MNDSSAIASKVWNYAHVLTNAGGGYGDSIGVRAARALITYLRFFKLANKAPEDFEACHLGRAGSPLPAASGAEGTQRPTLRTAKRWEPRRSRDSRRQTDRFKCFTYDRSSRGTKPTSTSSDSKMSPSKAATTSQPRDPHDRNRRIPRSRAGRIPCGGGSFAH